MKIYFNIISYVGPYCIGILLAKYYNKYLNKSHINNKYCSILWRLCMATMTMIILITFLYASQSMPSDNMLSALYASIHCILWCICMAYIIYTCGTDGAPVLNGILLWKGWQIISKLTYQLLESISGFFTKPFLCAIVCPTLQCRPDLILVYISRDSGIGVKPSSGSTSPDLPVRYKRQSFLVLRVR
ncbi:unnamed protein product [Oppiella nova]|uniref:Uncharacterized protein n=1 Tax=Oppiella nova TaxID=334625 RepID=A0A7R9M1V2_9ACAR|nr:unnamed protein product [Oppiella nova]CAG2169216.1 unnamed protein product [Oppiella nova]